jgi:Holliday junction resolvase RusA-like endonuclease
MLEPIFIPFNTPSSKNSKRWTGTRLISSKLVLEYKKETKPFWEIYRWRFRKMLEFQAKPYRIGFYFFRSSKRKADYTNLVQLPLDLMQEHGWLEDDDMSTVIPVFLGYEVKPHNPGVRIEVLEQF